MADINVLPSNSTPTTTERPAELGELCSCGRAAVTVFITPAFGGVGYCGLSNVGQITPCVFCGEDEPHTVERCPQYRMQPAAGEA